MAYALEYCPFCERYFDVPVSNCSEVNCVFCGVLLFTKGIRKGSRDEQLAAQNELREILPDETVGDYYTRPKRLKEEYPGQFDYWRRIDRFMGKSALKKWESKQAAQK